MPEHGKCLEVQHIGRGSRCRRPVSATYQVQGKSVLHETLSQKTKLSQIEFTPEKNKKRQCLAERREPVTGDGGSRATKRSTTR